MKKYTEQEKTRRDSLKKIQELGINPYPAEEYIINTNSKEIKNGFSKQGESQKKVQIAGRIMSRRIMGKASFIEIKDFSGGISIESKMPICRPVIFKNPPPNNLGFDVFHG